MHQRLHQEQEAVKNQILCSKCKKTPVTPNESDLIPPVCYSCRLEIAQEANELDEGDEGWIEGAIEERDYEIPQLVEPDKDKE